MVNFITQLARYLIPVLMIIYTIRCFTAFGINSARRNRRRYNGQNSLMFIIQFTMNFVLFLNDPQISRIIFYAAQVCFLIVALYMYSHIYKEASKMLINNMFFMLMLGFTMLSRLDMQLAIKQFGIAVGSVLLSLVIPGFIAKARHLSHLAIVYGALGIAVIGSVFFFGKTVYGATNWISIGGIGFQPSELAKIIFVFFIASMLYKDTSLKRIIITTICAAAFVVLLVAETDLGAAVIFFITYLVMLYVATRRFLYTGVGLGAGVAAALFGYKHFSHVQRRVLAWRDPWGNYDDAGYQICQSLMAIGTGSWFGMGLMQGIVVTISQADIIKKSLEEGLILFAAGADVIRFVPPLIITEEHIAEMKEKLIVEPVAESIKKHGKNPARFIRILKKAVAVLIEKARSFRPGILASLERFKAESAEQDRKRKTPRKVVKDRERIPERSRRKSR